MTDKEVLLTELDNIATMAYQSAHYTDEGYDICKDTLSQVESFVWNYIHEYKCADKDTLQIISKYNDLLTDLYIAREAIQRGHNLVQDILSLVEECEDYDYKEYDDE